MSSLRSIERAQFETLLGMSSGYVLDFSNRTFQEFMREAVNVDIYDDRYSVQGNSKACRLRAFWDQGSDVEVGKVLAGLIEYWSFQNSRPDEAQAANLAGCRRIAERLLGKVGNAEDAEKQFLQKDLRAVSLKGLNLDSTLLPILESRMTEASRCVASDAPLAAIFLCGSILEGLLLGTAAINPKQYNVSPLSPKDDAGKVKQFHNWKLAELIDVACDVGHLKLDVKKFGHSLRDFRNYIHPHQQMASGFTPDRHTADICLQVLRAAIASLKGERN